MFGYRMVFFAGVHHDFFSNHPKSRSHGRQTLHQRVKSHVSTLVGMLASGETRERILEAYPYLESADLDEALSYAAWRLEEREEDFTSART
jgi:uncharacterized protein (DUF433 family)